MTPGAALLVYGSLLAFASSVQPVHRRFLRGSRQLTDCVCVHKNKHRPPLQLLAAVTGGGRVEGDGDVAGKRTSLNLGSRSGLSFVPRQKNISTNADDPMTNHS